VLDDPSIGREHARKYAAELFALGIDRAEYATTYSAVVRIVPTRFRRGTVADRAGAVRRRRRPRT
jgi:hypothetical protein